MAVHKQYFTATAFTALTGYYWETAENEVQLSATAPGSGELTGTVLSVTDTCVIAAAVPSAVHDDNDWTALPDADCQVSLDVTATGADLTFDMPISSRHDRFNSSGSRQGLGDNLPIGVWSSDADTTGIKVATPTDTPDLGTAASDDLYGVCINLDNGSHMDDFTFTVGLGTDTWVEAPWAAPGGPTDQPYRDHFIQLLSQ